MKKTRNLFLTLLLGLMLSMLFASSSMAASTVAKIGSTKYTSLEAAIKKVKNGQTIVLQKNVTYSEVLSISRSGKSFTIDLNKKTITFSGSAYLYVKKGTVTIKNGTLKLANTNAKRVYESDATIVRVGKSGKLTIAGGTYKGLFVNAGTLTIKKGTIYCYPSTTTINNTGTLTISGGTFSDDNADIAYDEGLGEATMVYNGKAGTVTITGGTFLNTYTDCGGYLLINYGSLAVSGGTFEATVGILRNYGTATFTKGSTGKGVTTTSLFGIFCNEGKLKVKAGSFTSTMTSALSAFPPIINTNGGVITISGGTFTSYYELFSCIAKYMDEAGKSITITGGTFKLKKAGVFFLTNHEERSMGTIKVTGGTFTAKKGYLYDSYTKKITIGSGVTTTVKAKVGDI